MLKLKLQYFGHLMRRVDSLEKTLMLGGIWGQEEKGTTEDETVAPDPAESRGAPPPPQDPSALSFLLLAPNSDPLLSCVHNLLCITNLEHGLCTWASVTLKPIHISV